jgi:hypothetical protein
MCCREMQRKCGVDASVPLNGVGRWMIMIGLTERTCCSAYRFCCLSLPHLRCHEQRLETHAYFLHFTHNLLQIMSVNAHT